MDRRCARGEDRTAAAARAGRAKRRAQRRIRYLPGAYLALTNRSRSLSTPKVGELARPGASPTHPARTDVATRNPLPSMGEGRVRGGSSEPGCPSPGDIRRALPLRPGSTKMADLDSSMTAGRSVDRCLRMLALVAKGTRETHRLGERACSQAVYTLRHDNRATSQARAPAGGRSRQKQLHLGAQTITHRICTMAKMKTARKQALTRRPAEVRL